MTANLEREATGRHYMALAMEYGHIELKAGTFLYSAKGLQALGMTDKETGEAVSFDEGEFYFRKMTRDPNVESIITDCYGPDNVMDCIEADNPDQGFNLTVTFKAAAKIIPFPGRNK